jgi:hypothetical protein
MGFIQDLQGKVIDAATYQLLERNFALMSENVQMLRDKCSTLEEKRQSDTARIRDLEAEISRLKLVCGSLPDQPMAEFEGLLWRRTPDGYSTTPHCMNCFGVMSRPLGDLTYVCSKCKYHVSTRLNPQKVIEHLRGKHG